jgi:dipeptidyl aminopeptidase/acylaminoacyl peptidase
VKIVEGASLDGSVPTPVYVESPLRVYAIARVEGDAIALVVMDLSNPSVPRTNVLISVKGFDFTGSLVRSRSGDVLGVTYLAEAHGTHWFDPRMRKIQEQVDAALPGTTNLLDCGHCENVENVVIKSTSDRSPPVYHVLRVGTGAIEPLWGARPWIDPAEMATTDMVRVSARDGLQIPVYVTRPRGVKGPAPTVVLVHGGPWVRGREWDWEPQAQFLASRGYVVVEPEFRGSTGYGDRLFRAGWKQWGQAMQDDVVDAALWAVKQGFADPARICIAGASYGGYATLMGLIRNPDVFQCGVQWLGVTDIDLMYSIHSSDLSAAYLKYGMPVMVGDREKDAERFAAVSPVRQAARIQRPLFMAYGALDRRVPIEHGQELREALERANRPFEWKVYDDEGHGWMSTANQVDFWTRVETFLARHLNRVQ